MNRAAQLVRRLGATAPPGVLVTASALRHGETPLQQRLRRRSISPVSAPDEPLSGTRRLDRQLYTVLDALGADDVRCAVLEAGTMRRRVVVVTSDQEEAARRALAAARRARSRRCRPGCCACTAVTPPSAATWSSGRWCHRHPPRRGQLLARARPWRPRANRWVRHLEAAERVPATAAVGRRSVPTFRGLLGPHLLDVTFPIDVVYTWVDGADPQWQRRKEQAWAGPGPRAPPPLGVERVALRAPTTS